MVIQRFHGGFTEKADPRSFLFYYNHCFFFIFKISFIGSLNIDYCTVEHSCVEVSAEDSETTDGCHTDLPANGAARDLLTKTLSGLNVGDITFDGHTCYTQQSIPGKLAAKCFQQQLIFFTISQHNYWIPDDTACKSFRFSAWLVVHKVYMERC